jgi:predicted ATPase
MMAEPQREGPAQRPDRDFGALQLVESHSEHLLARLQRRIAEQKLDRGLLLAPGDIALYFCKETTGQSNVGHLQLDQFGNITNWPEDFFGNPLSDAVAMVDAAAKRANSSPSNT